MDLGLIEEQASSSAFFTLYGSLHPSLPTLAAKRLEMTLPSLWGSSNPVVLNFGTNGQGSYSIGGVESTRVKHVQASLLDHQQPAYSAQVDAASRSRSWTVWSKPAESGGGSMALSGLSNEVATFGGPAEARAYIASVGAVKNGHTYVFSLNVDSSSGSGAITLAKLNGINHFTGPVASRLVEVIRGVMRCSLLQRLMILQFIFEWVSESRGRFLLNRRRFLVSRCCKMSLRLMDGLMIGLNFPERPGFCRGTRLMEAQILVE